MTKACTRCGVDKSLKDFHVNKRSADGRAYWCKSCKNAFAKEWRDTKVGKKRKKRWAENKYKAKRLRIELDRLEKEQRGCEHPDHLGPRELPGEALDWHHTDPELKDNSISQLIWDGASEARVLAEKEKCIVFCANCHRIHHAGEQLR